MMIDDDVIIHTFIPSYSWYIYCIACSHTYMHVHIVHQPSSCMVMKADSMYVCRYLIHFDLVRAHHHIIIHTIPYTCLHTYLHTYLPTSYIRTGTGRAPEGAEEDFIGV